MFETNTNHKGPVNTSAEDVNKRNPAVEKVSKLKLFLGIEGAVIRGREELFKFLFDGGYKNPDSAFNYFALIYMNDTYEKILVGIYYSVAVDACLLRIGQRTGAS